MEGSSNSDEGFDRGNVLVKSEIQPLNIDFPLSSDGDNSSVASINEGCESHSSSSWDSEPEIDIPSVINCHEGIKLEENYLVMEEQNQFVGVENMDDGLLWEMDNRSYDDLLKKFMEKEEELRYSNFVLQLSQQEIFKLNVKVENSEAQLDNVCEELKLREEELNKQKELSKEAIFKLKLSEEENFKLKIQIDKSENQLDNVREELKLKEEELKLKEKELSKLTELSEEEIFKLKIQTEKSENWLDNVRKELKLKEEELNKQKELSEEEIFKLKLSEEENFKLKIQIDKSENRLDNVREELKLKEEELKLKEEELSKLKELLEEEMFKLKIQMEKSENWLDNVRKELKLKEEELNKQKELSEEEIFKLKIQIEKSENRLDNVHEELKMKKEELNKQKESLEEEIFKLKIQIEKSDNQLDNVSEELKLKEEELNKLKELSEEEIFKLKIQIEKSENQLDNVREELKLKEEELNKEKELSQEKLYELRIEIVKSKNQLDNVQEELKLEVEKLHGQLKAAQENMAKSELELVSNRKQIQMLGDSVIKYESKATNHEQEMQKLKSLKSELDFWTKRNLVLTTKLEDCQSRNKELENKLSRDRCAKVEQEMVLEEEINCLREELGQKMHLVEAANKEKEMVVIERNEAKAKIEKLEHEIFSCNDQLSNMRGCVKELEASLTEAVVIYKNIRNEGKMLKLRVEELEKEVTRQNGVISDKDEEKREAIRQLCYSVEYYRSEYRQLVQAINKVASPWSPRSCCYSFLRLH